MGAVRKNWRDIPVVELTDDEVALMSERDAIRCAHLLAQRARAKGEQP